MKEEMFSLAANCGGGSVSEKCDLQLCSRVKHKYVGNLDSGASEELLMAVFSHIGPVRSCKLIHEDTRTIRELHHLPNPLLLLLLLLLPPLPIPIPPPPQPPISPHNPPNHQPPPPSTILLDHVKSPPSPPNIESRFPVFFFRREGTS
ncbi:uncharacterized protein [Palaemon carinicauda]|uniref:uncharacterized protein n=1 Tax=Palaemon carinicauda TaxID=392227 RepID=UPI0035B6088F